MNPDLSSLTLGTSSFASAVATAQLARTISLAAHPIPDGLRAQLERLRPSPELWQDPRGSTAWDDVPTDLRESFTK